LLNRFGTGPTRGDDPRERDPAFIASIAKAREQVGQGKTHSNYELGAMFDGR
jgi:hypothetical protein